jgi:hypothetical protein
MILSYSRTVPPRILVQYMYASRATRRDAPHAAAAAGAGRAAGRGRGRSCGAASTAASWRRSAHPTSGRCELAAEQRTGAAAATEPLPPHRWVLMEVGSGADAERGDHAPGPLDTSSMDARERGSTIGLAATRAPSTYSSDGVSPGSSSSQVVDQALAPSKTARKVLHQSATQMMRSIDLMQEQSEEEGRGIVSRYGDHEYIEIDKLLIGSIGSVWKLFGIRPDAPRNGLRRQPCSSTFSCCHRRRGVSMQPLDQTIEVSGALCGIHTILHRSASTPAFFCAVVGPT